METNQYTVDLNDVPTYEEGNFDEINDEEYEWECQGGQKIDRDGHAVDKYYKREVPLEIEDQYTQDEEKDKAFGACKPWLGAIVAPTEDVKIDKNVPHQRLAMEYVYGYRAIDSRNNIFYTAQGNEVVYMTAAVGVVLNTETLEQRFFGGVERSESHNYHDDDISSLAIHPSRTIVATGQVGKDPSICIWNTADCSLITKFKLGKDTRAVKCLGFSNSGKYLAAVGDDNDHTVCAWDWQSGKKIATTRGGPDAILDLNFCSTQDNLFATVGKRGVSFWTIGAGTLVQKKGIFGSQKASDMYSCEWLSNGKCITGALNGSIYVWTGQSCSKVIKAHNGLVSTISAIPGGVVTGGKDNALVIYTEDFKEIRRLQVSALPKALDQNGKGNFVVGLRDGTIVEFVNGLNAKRLMLSHSDGELWGLTICPKTGCIITTADDNRVMVWDPTRHQCVNGAFINAVPGPKPKTMGASTLSVFPPNQCARSVAINHVTGHIAIGANNGELSIRAAINQLDQVIATKHDAKEWIEALQYSPCGKYLAAGSHDNAIYIYNSDYKLIAKCKKHSSFITSIDWSVDSKHIQAVDGAYELLFFNAQTGSQETAGASALRDEQWATWTSKLGWPVQGIFPSGVDGSHINGVDRSKNGDLIATGDDWRLVNLLKYPCLKGGKPVSYTGHSEHVVRIAFDNKDEYLYTIGGYDRTLIQWKIL